MEQSYRTWMTPSGVHRLPPEPGARPKSAMSGDGARRAESAESYANRLHAWRATCDAWEPRRRQPANPVRIGEGGDSLAPLFRRSRANRPAAHKAVDTSELRARRSSNPTIAHDLASRKSFDIDEERVFGSHRGWGRSPEGRVSGGPAAGHRDRTEARPSSGKPSCERR